MQISERQKGWEKEQEMMFNQVIVDLQTVVRQWLIGLNEFDSDIDGWIVFF